MQLGNLDDSICALSTAQSLGAIGMIRVSGVDAIQIVGSCLNKTIDHLAGYRSTYSNFHTSEEVLDEVIATVFKAPRSFTGEDTVELSFHGSPYILQKALAALVAAGCRLAGPGEFSQRAFLNGKMDLTQTEAIADLIASESRAAHEMALKQLKGGFSREIVALKDQLIHFASLIELELDFSEEDVEFADRKDLKELVDALTKAIRQLVESFATGNALKKGIPVAIVGAPNSGKSTLLNALLNDNKAIVSDIAGTTRDAIEDKMVMEGVEYRFIDTAGIRETEDTVEKIGIERTFEKANEAMLILHLVDANAQQSDIEAQRNELLEKVDEKPILMLANKMDLLHLQTEEMEELDARFSTLGQVRFISAANKQNLDSVTDWLGEKIKNELQTGDRTIVNNARHHAALSKALEDLQRVRNGLDANLTGDFLAMDIRQALHHLGEITGEITTDDLLGNIFSRFCIGK